MITKFSGMGIVWEHRYYGESLPGEPLSLNTTAEDLQYLTIEQALEDVAYFARAFTRSNYTDLTPDKTPWVFVGASYPGARAAWMRNFYPNIIYASYAASAPVQARVDFSSYYDQVYRSMVANGFGNCTKDLTAAVHYIDEILDTSPYNIGNDTSPAGKNVTALKESFLGQGYGNGSNSGFAQSLSTDIPGNFQYSGVEAKLDGTSAGIRGLCDYISTADDNKTTSGADGWAKTKGAAYVVDRWASYGTCANGTCGTGDEPVQDSDSIAWLWQTCTQVGYFQAANIGDHQLSPKYNKLSRWIQQCMEQFPHADGTPVTSQEYYPDVQGTNDRLGGWTIRPSNVFWSNGEFDPWRSLSPMSTEPFSPNYPVTDTPIPACLSNSSELSSNSSQPPAVLDVRQTASNPGEVFGFVLPNAEHGFDLGGRIGNYSQDALDHTRMDFETALTGWLKCFQPGANFDPANGTAGNVGVKPGMVVTATGTAKSTAKATGPAATATATPTGAAERVGAERVMWFSGIAVGMWFLLG